MIRYPETQEDVISLLHNANVRIEYHPTDGTYRFNSNDMYEVLKFVQACIEQDTESIDA